MLRFITRDLFGKKSLLSGFAPDLRVRDLDLTTLNVDDGDLERLDRALHDNRVIFSWVKGDHVTVMIDPEGMSNVRFNDALNALGIVINPEGKTELLPKRLARLLSPRDMAVYLNEEDLPIKIVDHDEFTYYNNFNNGELDPELLLDGLVAIKESFVRAMARRSGIKLAKLRRAKGLSMAAVTPDGMVKAFAYIVPDRVWPYGGDVLATSSANIKKELHTKEGVAHFVADIFFPYRDPKSNPQLDVMLGSMLYGDKVPRDALIERLQVVLSRIREGNAVKHIDDFSLPSYETKLDVGKTINEDFAVLRDMFTDASTRGLDYRAFPNLVNMLGISERNFWWNRQKRWPYYPLRCAWSRPIITESGAGLINDPIKVERGTIRSIRDGAVWVVNDLDFVEFFSMDSGGADQDDMWILLFVTINGEQKVITIRNPIGRGEFGIFDYVAGDPYPVWETRTEEITFPELTGPVQPMLHEMLASGEMTMGGLPEGYVMATPLPYDEASVYSLASDLVLNTSGVVGSVINAYVLAQGTNQELLKNVPCSMEDIIDSFTKGGGMEIRQHLTTWAAVLVDSVANSSHEGVLVDPVLWRARSNGSRLNVKTTPGFWTRYRDVNNSIRDKFSEAVRGFAQEQAGGELADRIAKILDVNLNTLANTREPLIVKARNAVTQWNMDIAHRTQAWAAYQDGLIIEQYGELNMAAKSRARLRGDYNLTTEMWQDIYKSNMNRIRSLAGPDEDQLSMLLLAVWLYAVTVPTRRTKQVSDKVVVNAEAWGHLMLAFTKFGLAWDPVKYLDYEVGAPPLITSWYIECEVCGKNRTVTSAKTYALFLKNHKRCNDHLIK